MSSPKTRKPGTGVPFDPEAVLLNDAGLLLNSHFSKALYEELRRARGGQHAENALVQIGCLHGLRDAHRAVDKAFGTPGPTGTLVSAPALTIVGTSSSMRRRAPWKLTSSMRSASASSERSIGMLSPAPALLTSHSMPPRVEA